MTQITTEPVKQRAPLLVAGALFGIGLAIAGMTRPEKVTGFLDITGAWDPSLAFVMLGAIGVHFVLHRLVLRRTAPLFDDRFHLPTRRDIDPRLLVGAGLFGVGWGLGGFCPGPALTSAAAGALPALVFVAAMIAGMLIERATCETK
ncbi:MAG: hypothetical protein JWM74_2726 [Myxococcaceae bacterium]|nr:hypothetical protein [Myxococcaceae bacterium]